MSQAEPYSIGITRWDWMTAALLLAAAEHHGDAPGRLADRLGLATQLLRDLLVEARLAPPPTASLLAKIEVEPDNWDKMLAQMLLAVVAEAPSHRAAAHILGLTRRELRTMLRQARRRIS